MIGPISIPELLSKMRVNNKQFYLKKMYAVHQNGLSTVLVKLAFANTLQDDIANSVVYKVVSSSSAINICKQFAR
jgi:hypothetical protein